MYGIVVAFWVQRAEDVRDFSEVLVIYFMAFGDSYIPTINQK